MNQSDIVLGWFSVILDDSQWFANHSENTFWPILSDSLWFLIILGDLEISLKLFWVDSWWFLMILGDSWTTLKKFWGDSWWFVNQSEILGWFSVICKSVWNGSVAICKLFSNDLWIINNPHKSSQIIHCMKEEELILQNI